MGLKGRSRGVLEKARPAWPPELAQVTGADWVEWKKAERSVITKMNS